VRSEELAGGAVAAAEGARGCVLQPVVVLVCYNSVGCWSLPRLPAELSTLFVSVQGQRHGNAHFGQHVCVDAVCVLSSQRACAVRKVPVPTLLYGMVLSC